MVNRLTLPLADWVGVASLAQASDAQLLHRFARAGEQQAFAMLVKRHGPMVWGVARRLLRSHQDAEDAFQASFLVLARKAASLRQPQLLTSWLHGVAHRTALHLRSRHKYAVPLEAEHEPADDTSDQLAWRDCGTRIDQAIEELPTSLRMAFLLCQAEGLTTLAASRRLNLPEGTVVSRLHRARKQLQRLLARHGITSAAGAVVACWNLALPESLSALTVRSLLGSAPSALVAGLAQGVLTTMMWIKATTAAVIVSTIGLVGIGTATIIAQGPGEKVVEKTSAPQPPAKNPSNDDRMIRLMTDLVETRRKIELMQGQERAVREILEAERQKNQAVRQFLETNALAEEQKSNQDGNNHEADLRAKKEAERQAMVRETEMREKQDAERQHLVMMQQAQAHQERRTVDLMKAKEHLASEIMPLSKERASLEEQKAMLESQGQELVRMLATQENQATKQLEQLAMKKANETEAEEVRHKLDSIRQQMKKEMITTNCIAMTTSIALRRVEAQLKLRDKLLLEVDEKLLRMQLKLDEK